jgi:hypothetical protein
MDKATILRNLKPGESIEYPFAEAHQVRRIIAYLHKRCERGYEGDKKFSTFTEPHGRPEKIIITRTK